MPLATDDIGRARTAYALLEERARSAEARAGAAESRLADVGKLLILLRQRVADLEAQSAAQQQQIEALTRLRADATLSRFISALGLAVAIGEASMTDRVIPDLTAGLAAYLVPTDGEPAIRFQQPELGAIAVGLSTASVHLVKTPPPPGSPAPLPLSSVLAAKQATYSDPRWRRFADATQIVAAATATLADPASWSFRFLASQAAAIAAREAALAAALPDSSAVTGYRDATGALQDLTAALVAKPDPIAADLTLLASALDATTQATAQIGAPP
jgi:hypothetical protein